MPTFFSEFERDELQEPISQDCIDCGWIDKAGNCGLRKCAKRRREKKIQPKKARKVRLSANIRPETRQRLHEMAAAEQCPMSRVLDELLLRDSLLQEIRKIVREELGK